MIPDIDLELMTRFYDYSLTEPKQNGWRGPVRDWFGRRTVYSPRWREATVCGRNLSIERAARSSYLTDIDGQRFQMVWVACDDDVIIAYRRPFWCSPILRINPEAVSEATRMARELGLNKGRRDDLRTETAPEPA